MRRTNIIRSNIPVFIRVRPTFDWYKALMDNTIFPSITSSTILFVRRSKTLYHSVDLMKGTVQPPYLSSLKTFKLIYHMEQLNTPEYVKL
jgi:hypothetical protein